MGRGRGRKASRPAPGAPPTTAVATGLDDAARLRWGRVVLGLAFAAGLLLAAPLYLSGRAYPLAPVLGALPPVPPPLDRLLLGALVLALAGVAFAPWPRAWAWAALGLGGALALGDQSRWQPWFYQYVLMLGALVLARSKAETLAGWRLVLVALYVWSGVQKLNVTFVTKVFPWMLEPLAGAPSAEAGPAVIAAGLAVAAFEIAIGLALLRRRTRRAAVVAAVATHGLVLALLGPLGHGQNAVVWPWNVALAALAVLLFWRADDPAPAILAPTGSVPRAALLVLVGILPAASFAGWWDGYLSGALYSGNIRAAVVVMGEATAARLPAEMRSHVRTTGPGIRVLDLWEWSVAELRAPSYPEVRVFRRVGAELCRAADAPPDLLLVVFGRPAALTGAREVRREDCAALGRG
jgi:hypothetical protein